MTCKYSANRFNYEHSSLFTQQHLALVSTVKCGVNSQQVHRLPVYVLGPAPGGGGPALGGWLPRAAASTARAADSHVRDILVFSERIAQAEKNRRAYSRTQLRVYQSHCRASHTIQGLVQCLDFGQRGVRMPQEVMADKSLQRELADSIIRMVPLDDIRILLACGAKVNEPVTQGLRPLHYAVWQRHVEATRLLLVRGCDASATDDCGYSALHLAAERGFAELVRLLLASGAAVSYRPDTADAAADQFPRTTHTDEPLRLAIRNKHYDVARLLLEHGADPNKRYFFGSEINLVSEPEYLELLLMFGAHPDARDRAGLTPLMKAARQRQGMESVLLLISHGADVNAITDARNDYRTVMHYAVLSGSPDMVNLLIKQGARVNYPGPGLNRPSPLDLAILKGDVEMLKLLLSAGADVNAYSSVIGTPLHVACSDSITNRREIVKVLLESGAEPNLKVYSVEDGAQLRPPLAEYLASDPTPRTHLVRALLRHGARVIMKTQFRDPDGILNHLQHVTSPETQDVFALLLDAAEAFDLCMIKRTSLLTPAQRQELTLRARTPLSLLEQARVFLRRLLGTSLVKIAPDLDVPPTLRSYILFEYS